MPLNRLSILVICGLTCVGVVQAQEIMVGTGSGATCQADQRYNQLQTRAVNIFDSYKAQLDAVLHCQAQQKFWDGTTCVAPTLTANNYVYNEIDQSVFSRKCNDGCRGNGHRGTTCNVYNVFTCTNGNFNQYQASQNGDTITITRTFCTQRKDFLGHNKDRNNGLCPF